MLSGNLIERTHEVLPLLSFFEVPPPLSSSEVLPPHPAHPKGAPLPSATYAGIRESRFSHLKSVPAIYPPPTEFLGTYSSTYRGVVKSRTARLRAERRQTCCWATSSNALTRYPPFIERKSIPPQIR